ncbi:hypothetical protein LCGC14_1410870 [marine sediment metagenome]|uniref:DisA/LigA helix-hairpin-helix motif domain-containing protein n=1 Tax=marine sediment metagenome TaxID=412755 RepID=A0A0F9JUN1_9ZZZZ
MTKDIDLSNLATLMEDNHEPSAMYSMLNQSVPTGMAPLNDQGYADYLWQGQEGPSQAERKTITNLLGDTASIEDQLRRQKDAHPDVRLMLVVEGVATPTPTGTTTWYESRTNKRIMHAGREFKLPLNVVYAWTYQVSRFLEVYFSPNMVCTARMLVAFYKSDQKAADEHNTFRRYMKPMDWHPNPQVQKLINIGSGIGEVKAEALIARFGTLWHVLSASPASLATVDGIGLSTARHLLRKAGRTDA